MTQRQRWLLLWALAGALAAASDVVPRLLKLNDRFATGFLSAEAYAMCAGLLVSGIVMGALDPPGAARWGVVVGLAPLADTAVRMAQEGSVGNLWPIAIVLALVLGVPAASAGALIGRTIRSDAVPRRT